MGKVSLVHDYKTLARKGKNRLNLDYTKIKFHLTSPVRKLDQYIKILFRW